MTQKSDPSVIHISNARLSFPALFQKKAFKDGKPKFSAVFLLNKKEHAKLIAEIQKGIEFVRETKWGKKSIKLLGTALRDGAEKEDTDGYGADVMFVTASQEKRVPIVDRDKTPLTEEDGKIYAGCYVNSVIRLWAQDNEFGKRINASLGAVQFVRDGEPFGEAGVDTDVAFANLDESKDGVI